MTGKTDGEIRRLITSIEIASDEIVKDMVITNISIEALRTIKSSVSKIQSTANSWSEDMPSNGKLILTRILKYIQGTVRYPQAIEFYADRIQSHVEGYLLLQHPYDADYEDRKDQEIKTYIELKRSTARMDSLAKEMRALVDQKISGDYPPNSPGYKVLVTRYNALQQQLNTETYRLDRLQEVAKENSLIRREVEKANTLSDMASLRTMTFEEFSEMAYENRDREFEEQSIFSAFEKVAEEVSEPIATYETEDAAFRKAVEETLLERLSKRPATTYEEQIAQLPKNELLEAILQLSHKIDKMEEKAAISEGAQKKRAEETHDRLSKLLEQTQDIVSLLADTCGDIEKEVEYCLSSKPMDLQGANLKLRSCVELYVRFVKGVDLNDKILFRNRESIAKKLQIADVPKYLSDTLAPIYHDANKFVHGDLSVIVMSDKEKAEIANQLREKATTLKELSIDTYDLDAGVQTFYLTLDRNMKKMLDDGRINRKYFEEEKNHEFKFYFEKLAKLAQHIKSHGNEVPSIQFRSVADIQNYLNTKEKAAQSAPVPPQKQPPLPAEKPMPQNKKNETAKPTEQKQQSIGKITKCFRERGYGFIDGNVHFYLSDVKNARECVVGAKVSYNPGKNDRGLAAKNITVLPSPEKTT